MISNMASTFILKRKSYAMPNLLRSAGKMNPISSMTMDVADNAIGKPIEYASQEAKGYVPEVKNAYAPNQGQGTEVQKQYGLIGTVAGAAKGLGKHVWNSRGTVGSMAGMGAGMAAGNYALNRYQADKAAIESGQSNQNGLTTGEKVGAGAAIAGTTAGVAAWTANNHNKAVKAAEKSITSNTNLLNDINKGSVVDRKIGNGSLLSENASRSISDSKKSLDKLNGKTMGMSNKKFKMGRNALLTAAALTTATVLANKGLKKAKENRDNQVPPMPQQPTQAQYSIAAIGRVVKSTLAGVKGSGIMTQSGANAAKQGFGSLIKQNVQNGTWGNIGRAAGAAVNVGTQSLVRGVGDAFTLGGGKKLVHQVAKGMKENGGNLGAKAGQFLDNHKTLALGASGATIGGTLYNVANNVGEKSVNAVTSLDKKTNEFMKSRDEALNNQM